MWKKLESNKVKNMTNIELMEMVAEAAYEACLAQDVDPENAFHEALNAARNACEEFRKIYNAELEGHECGDVCNDCHDAAWEKANDATWESIFDAAHLAVVGHGFQVAHEEGLMDEEQIDERVGVYVDSVLGEAA